MTVRAEASHPGRIRLSRRAGGLVAAMLLLGVGTLVPLRQYHAQQARMAEMERRVVYLQQANEQLARRVRQLKDPAYLERLARECLGLVKEGEIAFVPVPDRGHLPPPRC